MTTRAQVLTLLEATAALWAADRAPDVLELALGTLAAAVGAEAGRAHRFGTHDPPLIATPARAAGAAALLAAERTALARSARAAVTGDGWHALGAPVRRTGALAFGRRGRPFSAAERQRFGFLVTQAGAALEQRELLERLRAHATRRPATFG